MLNLDVPVPVHSMPYLVAKFLYRLDKYPEVIPQVEGKVTNVMSAEVNPSTTTTTSTTGTKKLSSKGNSSIVRAPKDSLVFLKFLQELAKGITTDSFCFTRRVLEMLAEEIEPLYIDEWENARNDFVVADDMDDFRRQMEDFMDSNGVPDWYKPDFSLVFGDDDSDDDEDDSYD